MAPDGPTTYLDICPPCHGHTEVRVMPCADLPADRKRPWLRAAPPLRPLSAIADLIRLREAGETTARICGCGQPQSRTKPWKPENCQRAQEPDSEHRSGG